MAMETKGNNVIDITKRLKIKRDDKPQKNDSKTKKSSTSGTPQVPISLTGVLDMTSRRKELIQNERRNVRRTVLSQFIGAFVVHPTKGLESVAIFDVSDAGLSFDMAMESGRYKDGESVSMRIYLSHDLYFPFTAKVINVRPGDGTARHGVSFDQDQQAAPTLTHFVKFLENLGTIARKDQGERLVGKAD